MSNTINTTKNTINYINITNDLNHKLKNNQIDTTGRIDEKIERNRLNYIVNYIYDEEPEATVNSDNFIFIKISEENNEYILKKKKITTIGDTKEYSYYTINISLGTEIFVKYQKIEEELEDLEDRYILYDIITEQDTKIYIYHKIIKNEFDPSKTLHLTNEKSLITDGSIQTLMKDKTLQNDIFIRLYNNDEEEPPQKEYTKLKDEDFKNLSYINKVNDKYYLFTYHRKNYEGYNNEHLYLYVLNKLFEIEQTYIIRLPKIENYNFNIDRLNGINTKIYILYKTYNNDYGILYFDYSTIILPEDLNTPIDVSIKTISLHNENNFNDDNNKLTKIKLIVGGEFINLNLTTDINENSNTIKLYIYNNELYFICKFEYNNNIYFVLCKFKNDKFEIINYFGNFNSNNLIIDYIVYQKNGIYNYCYFINVESKLYLYYSNENMTNENEDIVVNKICNGVNGFINKDNSEEFFEDSYNHSLIFVNNNLYILMTFIYPAPITIYEEYYKIYQITPIYENNNLTVNCNSFNVIINNTELRIILYCFAHDDTYIYLMNNLIGQENNQLELIKVNTFDNSTSSIIINNDFSFGQGCYFYSIYQNDILLVNNSFGGETRTIYLYRNNLDVILNIDDKNFNYKNLLNIENENINLYNNIIVNNNNAIIKSNPINDLDIVNKKYVDLSIDNIDSLKLTVNDNPYEDFY